MYIGEAFQEAIGVLWAAAGPHGGKWTQSVTEQGLVKISHDPSGCEFLYEETWVSESLLRGVVPGIPVHPVYDKAPPGKVNSFAQSIAQAARSQISCQAMPLSNQLAGITRLSELRPGNGLIVLPKCPLQVWPVNRMIVLGLLLRPMILPADDRWMCLAQDVETGLLHSFTQSDLELPRIFPCQFAPSYLAVDELLLHYAYLLTDAKDILVAQNWSDVTAGASCQRWLNLSSGSFPERER